MAPPKAEAMRAVARAPMRKPTKVGYEKRPKPSFHKTQAPITWVACLVFCCLLACRLAASDQDFADLADQVFSGLAQVAAGQSFAVVAET